MRKFILILLIGFIIRLGLVVWSFQFPQNPDLLRHRDWGRVAYLYGVKDTYLTDHLTYGTTPNNLPPGSIYLISGMYNVQIQTSKLILKIFQAKEGSIYFLNVSLLDAFLKLPFIIADVILSFLIYKIVRSKRSEKEAIFASSLFLFNPAVFYNSAVWGQMDSLNNLFFYLAIYLFLFKKNFLSILSSILSLFFKLTLFPLIVIFFLLLFISKKVEKKSIFFFLFSSILTIFILFLPVSTNPQEWFKLFFANNISQELQNVTVNAFNFWFMLFKPFVGQREFPLSQAVYLGFPLGVWASTIFIIVFAPIVRNTLIAKNRILKPENLFLLFSVVSLLIFLFFPRMHERYLYPIFPLLATYIGLKGKYLKLFLFLSFLHLLNLLVVWHPMLNSFVAFFNNSFFQWGVSVAMVISGIYLYTKALKVGFR